MSEKFLKIGICAWVEVSYQGFTTRVVNIINHLSKSNDIVVYFSASGNVNSHKTELPLYKSIAVKRFPFATSARAYIPSALYNEPKVYRFLKNEYASGNFDVLQIENIYGACLASKCDFPVVGVFHGRMHEEYSYSKRLLLSQGRRREFLYLLLNDSYTYLREKKLPERQTM